MKMKKRIIIIHILKDIQIIKNKIDIYFFDKMKIFNTCLKVLINLFIELGSRLLAFLILIIFTGLSYGSYLIYLFFYSDFMSWIVTIEMTYRIIIWVTSFIWIPLLVTLPFITFSLIISILGLTLYVVLPYPITLYIIDKYKQLPTIHEDLPTIHEDIELEEV